MATAIAIGFVPDGASVFAFLLNYPSVLCTVAVVSMQHAAHIWLLLALSQFARPFLQAPGSVSFSLRKEEQLPGREGDQGIHRAQVVVKGGCLLQS